MISASVTNLLANHVDRVLNSAIRNDGNDRGIRDPKVFNSMNTELWIDDTLVNTLRQTSSTARIWIDISLWMMNGVTDITYGIQSGYGPEQLSSSLRQTEEAFSKDTR